MRYLYVLIIFLFVTCIAGYDPEIRYGTPKLVVDGLITNRIGIHEVRLTFSTRYANDESVFDSFISDADVSIKDNLGEVEKLALAGSGLYKTTSQFQGIVGREYTLFIKLNDGKEYSSSPELLKPVPEIDTIYTTYKEFNRGFLRGEFQVFLNTLDPSTKHDFYRWNWTHYRQTPYCYERTVSQDGVTYASKCCQPCWLIERCDGCINIFSDKFINGNLVSQIPILKIPYDSKESYFLHIEQFSLTQGAYAFWKSVTEQINNTGGIFDKPPVTIQGNVTNTANPDELVLGYFGASAVSEEFVYIKRDKQNNPPFGTPVVYKELTGCYQCSIGPYRTTIKPEGWE